MATIQPLLKTNEVCAIFKVTARTLSNWVNSEKKGFPKPVIKGYPNKWKQADIEDYLNQDNAA